MVFKEFETENGNKRSQIASSGILYTQFGCEYARYYKILLSLCNVSFGSTAEICMQTKRFNQKSFT